MQVSFNWHGTKVVEAYDNVPCSRAYDVGDHLNAYVASNDPGNIQPSADWILHPDEYDPFDFIGPNGLPGFEILSGAFVGVLGLALIAAAIVQLARPRGASV
jgi:hypothetical protein